MVDTCIKHLATTSVVSLLHQVEGNNYLPLVPNLLLTCLFEDGILRLSQPLEPTSTQLSLSLRASCLVIHSWILFLLAVIAMEFTVTPRPSPQFIHHTGKATTVKGLVLSTA